MEIAALEAQITELVGQLSSANYRLLHPARRVRSAQGWSDSATPFRANGISKFHGDSTCTDDEDGSLIIKASLPAENGALFMSALDHRQVHDGGVEVQVLDDGALRFVVRGRSFESPVPARRDVESGRPSQDVTRGHWAQLGADLAANRITITADTAVMLFEVSTFRHPRHRTH